MREAAQSPYVVRFDSFEVNLRSGELRRNGERLKLPEQSFQILGMLLERAGEVVMRKEIQERLWPNDTVVEFENSINAAIKRLRFALGDTADHPRYVETLARRGYRWIGRVELPEASIPEPQVLKPFLVQSAAPATTSNLTGKRVSHYRVLEILGGGGMGVVYKAEDIKLGRRVALKFLPEELSSDVGAMERFEREARAASALNHPNICTIHAVEEHAGQPFIVMELLEGQTLGEMLAAEQTQKRVLPLDQIIHIATQITEGLGAAHSKGIIHRDIKPANIFVTHHGQAKILDFGLAKLLAPEGADIPQLIASDGPSEVRSLNLSKTGIAMGTAGYMSPEQVRGEKLDRRTDLFSFGLVIYEMATGQRAFTGETAPIIHDAIVNDKPRGVRELSPKLPRKLEQIVDKALQKDCDLRYQTAFQLRDDLNHLKPELAQTVVTRRKLMAIVVAAVLLSLGVIYWFAKRRPSLGMLELNQRQLTSNSFENAVQGGAISPDGRYLAYRDKKQMYLKDIVSGDTKIIPKPDILKDADVQWDINPWFRDGSSFLVTANLAPSQRRSIWTVPSSGGAPRKLYDDAAAWSVSPDGALIAFTTSNGRADNRIWLMNSKGEQAHVVYEADGNSNLARVEFSASGERLLFLREDVPPNGDLSLESVWIDRKESSPTSVISPSEQKASGAAECRRGCRLHDFFWLPDGRLIYVLKEPGPVGDTCYLWEKRLDPHTAETVEKPHPLTKAGSCIESLTVTADGRQLAFRKSTPHDTSYLAELSPDGTRITNPRHFPRTESSDGAAGWTPDSQALILVSNRSGHYGIYKQALDEETAQPLVTDGYGRDPHLTPDGKWILYLGDTENQTRLTAPAPLMRVPITGGRSEFVFTAKPWALITCASAPSKLCVVDEPTDDREQAIISAVDPLKGRGIELVRYKINSKDITSWSAISPDGKRVAYIPDRAGPIFIHPLADQPTTQIPVNGWSNLQNLAWSADGKALYLSADMGEGKALLHIDLHGKVNVVWENPAATGETIAFPSPDGRHLAMQSWTTSSNMWMLENF